MKEYYIVPCLHTEWGSFRHGVGGTQGLDQKEYPAFPLAV